MKSPWVLMYHSIDDCRDDPYGITISPERLRQQMRALQRRGLRGTTMREVLDHRASSSRGGLVGLTFDDGYEDFAEHAMPILLHYGFTATLYVVAERLGLDNAWDPDGPRKPLMSADRVREVAIAGMEIGSHGLQHRNLVELAPEDVDDEVGRSRVILEGVLGNSGSVTGFCYPYGNAGMREREAVRMAGYGYGVAIRAGRPRSTWAVPRSYVGERDGSLRLAAKWARTAVGLR